jgi:histidinol phosphatase-like PHP family hydrolase
MSTPDRQDLKMSLLHSALKEGARISLGTDAHHPWQLAFMDFALASALLVGYQQNRIVNFMPVQDLLNWSARVQGHGNQ